MLFFKKSELIVLLQVIQEYREDHINMEPDRMMVLATIEAKLAPYLPQMDNSEKDSQ